MTHKFFRAPVASYDEANQLMTTLIQVGDGTWLGPSNTPTRPIVADLVYWPQQYDPEASGSQIEKETFACRYYLDLLAPEYSAPPDIEEVTQEEYFTARNTAFPPEE